MPKISIITSTYNASSTLKACIDSVKAQTNQDFEYIIIDGGSKDSTIKIVQENLDTVTTWISESDMGIYDAWNKGIKLATGEWIMFLGADDLLLPETIDNYIAILNEEELNSLDYISGKVELVSSTGAVIKIWGTKWMWKDFSRFMNVAHVASIHSKKYFEQYGVFDANFKIAGDYELLLRAKKNLRYRFLDKIVARMGYGGVSSGNSKVFKEALIAKINSGGLNPTLCIIDDKVARFKFFIKSLIKYGK